MKKYKEEMDKSPEKRQKIQTEEDDLDDLWVETPEAVAAMEAAHSMDGKHNRKKPNGKQEKSERKGTTEKNEYKKYTMIGSKRIAFVNERATPLLAELRAKKLSLKEANNNLESQKELVKDYKDIINDKIKQLEQKQDEIDALTIKNNKLIQAIVKIKETMNENIDAAEVFCDTTRNCVQQFKELNIGRFEMPMNDLINEFPHN